MTREIPGQAGNDVGEIPGHPSDQEEVHGVWRDCFEAQCWADGLTPDKIVVVGEKNFGESNGPVYAKRHRPDYFEQSVEVEGGAEFMDRNSRFREFYGERFLDLMSFVAVDDGRARVFTPDHRFISADCRNLTKRGARYFAGMIDWEKYLN